MKKSAQGFEGKCEASMKTIEEAVAYIDGEPFSDHPACPVISAFLRSYKDSVSSDVRQTLKPFVLRMVGTKSTRAVEERRAMIAADWLVRTHTPAWLRLAGLNEQAKALAELPEITALAQVPSIRGPIEAARQAAGAAAGAAAGDAAWDAAGAAAWDAARAAAWDAAWDAAGAAARAAAGAAAGDAAWAAARDAAGAAARAAAWDAAGAAARAAAWAAARAAARAKLAPTVLALQAAVPDLIERMLAVTEVQNG